MAKIISIANQKGGVGKTTTAHSVGAGLHIRGFKVLLIDLDPQCNLSQLEGFGEVDSNAKTMLCENPGKSSYIHTCSCGDIIPSTTDLASADIDILEVGKEYRLREKIEKIRGDYDYIIIDTPPSLGVLSINALTASDGLIVATQADMFGMEGITQLCNTIETVRKYCNPDLLIFGILITRFNKRAIVSTDVAETLEATASELSTKLYRTKIRECIGLKEIQFAKNSIFDYAPKSNASIDYNSLIDEILED